MDNVFVILLITGAFTFAMATTKSNKLRVLWISLILVYFTAVLVESNPAQILEPEVDVVTVATILMNIGLYVVVVILGVKRIIASLKSNSNGNKQVENK